MLVGRHHIGEICGSRESRPLCQGACVARQWLTIAVLRSTYSRVHTLSETAASLRRELERLLSRKYARQKDEANRAALLGVSAWCDSMRALPAVGSPSAAAHCVVRLHRTPTPS